MGLIGGGTKTMALVAAWTRLARVAEKIGHGGWKGMPVAAEAMQNAQVRRREENEEERTRKKDKWEMDEEEDPTHEERRRRGRCRANEARGTKGNGTKRRKKTKQGHTCTRTHRRNEATSNEREKKRHQPPRKQRSGRGLCKHTTHARNGSKRRRQGNVVVDRDVSRCVRRADLRVDALGIQTREFHGSAPSFAAGVTTTEDVDTVTGLERCARGRENARVRLASRRVRPRKKQPCKTIAPCPTETRGRTRPNEPSVSFHRHELEYEEKGVDIFAEDYAWIHAPPGTIEKPVVVTSDFTERIVGVTDPEDDNSVIWGVVREGEPPKQIVEDGEYFILKRN